MTNSKITRRDFLKLGGVGVASLIVGGCRSIQGETAIQDLDLFGEASIWEGDMGEYLGEELGNYVYSEQLDLYPKVRDEVLAMYGVDLGSIDADSLKENVVALVKELVDRGREVSYAKKNNLLDVESLVYDRYYEIASFVYMLIQLYEYQKVVGLKEFVRNLTPESHPESLAAGFSNSSLGVVTRRRNLFALWNYNWELLASGGSDDSRIAEVFADPTGSGLRSTPSLSVNDGYLENPVGFSDQDRTEEVVETVFDNFDPEVAKELADCLKELGLEGIVDSVIYEKGIEFKARAEKRNSSVHMFITDVYNRISPEVFNTKRREYLLMILHEVYHGLSEKRKYLSKEDRLKLRNLEMEIYGKISPFTDLERALFPNGEDHFYTVDNEATLYSYPLTHWIDTIGLHREDLNSCLSEFVTVLSCLTGERLLEVLGGTHSVENLTIKTFLGELESLSPNLEGVSKLIADEVLQFKDKLSDIQILNELAVGRRAGQYRYGVLPIIFTHLILHRKEDVIKALLPEKDPENAGSAQNYIEILHKKLRRFVYGSAGEELLAVAFSVVMMDKLDNKGDKSSIDVLDGMIQKFQKIVEIYRNNGLV